MGRADDHSGEPARIEQPFFLVEIPTARLLREQPSLQAVREASDDALRACHLLVEISAEAAELLCVAEVFGLDGLVVAGREGLIIGLRTEVPVAPAGRGDRTRA